MKPRGKLTLQRHQRQIVLSYPFDEGGGTVMYNRGYAGRECNSAIAGAPVWRYGPDGMEMVFDGSNDKIDLDGPEIGFFQFRELDNCLNDGGGLVRDNGAFSIRCRFRTTSTTTLLRLFHKAGFVGGALCNFNWPIAGKVTCYITSTAGADELESTGTPAVNDGKYHELVFIHDRRDPTRTNWRHLIYLDGRLNAQRTSNGATTGPQGDGHPLHIGTSNFGGTWIGSMSLFEVHNRVLNDREIAGYWADPWQDYRVRYWRAGIVQAPTVNRRRRVILAGAH